MAERPPQSLWMFVIWRKTTFHAFGWATFVFMVILMVMGVALSFKTNEHLWYLNRFNIGLMLFGSMGLALLIILLSAVSSYLQLKRTIFLFHSTPEEVRDYLGMELQAETLNTPMAYPQMKIAGSLIGLPFDTEYFQHGGPHFVQRLYFALPSGTQPHKRTRHYQKNYGKQGVSLAHFGLLRSVPYKSVKKTAQTWVVSSLDSLLKIAQEERLIPPLQTDADNSTL